MPKTLKSSDGILSWKKIYACDLILHAISKLTEICINNDTLGKQNVYTTEAKVIQNWKDVLQWNTCIFQMHL